MSDFVIEKNVPVPPLNAARQIYPWPDMAVGDSVFVADQTTTDNAAIGARVHGYRHQKKFAARREGSGVRIWRTA